MTQQCNEVEIRQLPLHRRIAENLGSQVSSGRLKPGQRLPSERQIAREFQASRATVRTALQHLEQAGLIARRERRSAVVSFRRHEAPYLRIGCGHPGLMSLFSRLGEMQILPPRCQLQLLDMEQENIRRQLLSQPAMGADVLICDLEYVNCFRKLAEVYYPVKSRDLVEIQIPPLLENLCCENGDYIAVPLGITPQVLYYNKAFLADAAAEVPRSDWDWRRFLEMAQRFTGAGRYGFQFRPTFAHISALMASRGGRLYQNDGRVAVHNSQAFEKTLRFIHDLVHVRKVAPILAKADQINLFSQERSALAMDGFDMLNRYREALGEKLGVTSLPGGDWSGGTMGGFAVVVMAGQKDLQPIYDLMRILLSANTQRLMLEVSAALPVREELLNMSLMQELKVPREAALVFSRDLRRFQGTNLPGSAEHKQQVETLFLEMWLGLDNIESICRRFRGL